LLALPCRQSNSKKRISQEDWERRLKDVKIRKEDMNRVVMNFLVTEVNWWRERLVLCSPVLCQEPQANLGQLEQAEGSLCLVTC